MFQQLPQNSLTGTDPLDQLYFDFSNPNAFMSNLGPRQAPPSGGGGGGKPKVVQPPPATTDRKPAASAAPAAAPAAYGVRDAARAAFEARLSGASNPLAVKRAYQAYENQMAGIEAKERMKSRNENLREQAREKNRIKKQNAQARLAELTQEVNSNKPLSDLLQPTGLSPEQTIDQMNRGYLSDLTAEHQRLFGYDKAEAARLRGAGERAAASSAPAQSTQPTPNVNALVAQTPTGQLASVAQQSYPMDSATADLIRSAYGDEQSGLGSAIRAMNPQERGSFLNGLLRYPPEERRRILDRMAQEEIAKSNSFNAAIAPVPTPPARSVGGEMRAATQGEMDTGRRIQELVAGGVPQDDAFRIATTGQGPDLSEFYHRELRALDERTPELRLGTQLESGLNFAAGEALGPFINKLLPSRQPIVLNRGPQTRDLAMRGAPTPQAGRVTVEPIPPAGLLPEGVPPPARARPMLDTATSGRTIITPPPQPKALPAAEASLARIAEPAAPAAKPAVQVGKGEKVLPGFRAVPKRTAKKPPVTEKPSNVSAKTDSGQMTLDELYREAQAAAEAAANQPKPLKRKPRGKPVKKLKGGLE